MLIVAQDIFRDNAFSQPFLVRLEIIIQGHMNNITIQFKHMAFGLIVYATDIMWIPNLEGIQLIAPDFDAFFAKGFIQQPNSMPT